MATKTNITISDDIDGTEGAKGVTFSVNGNSWEIDLSDKNFAALEKALDPYMKAGRKTGSARVRRSSGSGAEGAKIRAWATANGYEVSERGRISAEIREAYVAANGK